MLANRMFRAVALMFVAMSLIPAGDTAGKLLTSQHAIAPLFVAWARFAVGTAAIAPLAPKSTWRLLRDPRLWLRGLMLVLGICCILTGLQTAPIASVFAAFFVGPIVSFALSAIWLKEPVTLLRTMAVAVGFLGVLLVVRPGLDADPGLFWAMAAGMFYGVYLTLSRALSHLGSPIALLTSQLVAGTIVLAPFGVMLIPDIDLDLALLFLASGLCSAVGNLLLLVAYKSGSATVLAPMVYFQLVAATGFGWWVFGTLPDALTWVGLTIIIAAGVVSASLGRAQLAPVRR